MIIPCAGAVARLRKDGIVEIRYADDHVASLPETRELAEIIALLGDQKPVAVLRIAGEYSDIFTGVREFLASETAQKNMLADAIVIRSLPQRILGNFYLKVNRPRKPTRLFTSVSEAERWLRDFIPCLN